MATSDQRLSEALQDVLGKRLAEQPQAMSDLQRRWRHSVRLFREAKCENRRTWQFNCHAFAVGLSETEEYWRINHEKPNVIASGAFVDRLLAGESPIRRAQVAHGDLVVYFASSVAHTGIVSGRTVLSKWSMGHLWRHSVFHVPVCYGSRVACYRKLPLERVVSSYIQHVA